jgi:hypothetical protein
MPVLSTLGAATAKAWGFLQQVASAVADPYFNYVTMLLTGNGTNGAQNNTFLDSSTNNFTITRNGNTTQGSFSPYGANWSNYFDTSAYLSHSADLIGSTTSTFTVDGWVYLTATPTTSFDISAYCGLSGEGNGPNNYMSFGPTSDLKLTLRWFDGGNKSAKSTTTLALNTWYYIACVVNSNAITMFINGVSETVTGTTTLTNRGGTASASYIGGKSYTYATLAGYISNIRVSSVARTITDQTAPLTSDANTIILTCQSNRFVDTSSSPKTLTIGGTPSVQRFSPFSPTASYDTATIGGSGYFDGTGDYLTTPSISLAGNFTIEGWFYRQSGNNYFFSVGDTATSSGIEVYIGSGGTALNVYSNASVQITTTPFPTSTWAHLALVRSGSTITMYVNGTSVGTWTSSATFSGAVYVGAEFYSGSVTGSMAGYISNFRIVNGTAVYTTTFTPPTAPVTAISGTDLLTNFTNAGIPDSAMMNDLETVGNAQVSTSVKKFGTGSLAFDGTGDWLTCSQSINLPANSDFTVEGWFYLTAAQADFRMIMGESTGGSGQYYCISSTGVLFQTGTSGGTQASFNYTFSQNTWYHIALVRSSNTVSCYVDGTSVSGTNTSQSAAFLTGTSYIGVGYSSSYPWNGYIDDLRITKGYARYTSNFTAPTAAFPTF